MRRLAAVLGLVVLLSVPAVATADYDYPSSGPTMGGTQPQAVGVTIVDFAFQPAYVAVAPGSTVSWYNAGAAPHTVTSTAGAFDSGAIGSGGGYGVTLWTPGTYSYYCQIHPSMTGTIVVSGM
jgi:plastocyanin